jgi:hypothetical protein
VTLNGLIFNITLSSKEWQPRVRSGNQILGSAFQTYRTKPFAHSFDRRVANPIVV